MIESCFVNSVEWLWFTINWKFLLLLRTDLWQNFSTYWHLILNQKLIIHMYIIYLHTNNCWYYNIYIYINIYIYKFKSLCIAVSPYQECLLESVSIVSRGWNYAFGKLGSCSLTLDDIINYLSLLFLRKWRFPHCIIVPRLTLPPLKFLLPVEVLWVRICFHEQVSKSCPSVCLSVRLDMTLLSLLSNFSLHFISLIKKECLAP